MKQAPTIWKLKELIEQMQSTQAEINGKWVPARPFGSFSWRNRLKAVWSVFTGKADVVIWPEGQ